MEQDRFKNLKERARGYIKEYDPAFVTNYMRTQCPKESQTVVIQADRLLEQTFIFEDKWDMEPCSTPYTLKEMIWDHSPNQDPEWIFMLNRHEYLHKLLIAFRLTKKKKYLKKLEWYMEHWIASTPILPEGSLTTRTIDTGIRCLNWQFLLIHLIGEDLMGQEKAELVLESMNAQFLNMKSRYLPKYTLSNWGVLQTVSICYGYLWFGEYLTGDGLEEWAWKELKNQLEIQILPDGSHWEQSMMYHMEVLLSSMKLLSYWKGDVPPDKAWLYTAVMKMSHYVMFAAGPDHCQIAQCDSDVTDLRDVMVKAGVLTGDRQMRFAGYESMDMDSAWLFGANGIRLYENLTPMIPEQKSLNAQDSGNLYIRSGWSEDSHFTYLQCGPLGSGHGHADLTHISLYYEGKPFLVDSGRYTYMEEDPLRPWFKSAQAHNVCVIDGQSHGIPKGAWGYDSYGECLKNYFREQGPFHYCEMAYHGTLAGGGNYLVIRRVMMADVGIWLIVNDIAYAGEHVIREYYHLDPKVEAYKDGQKHPTPNHEIDNREPETHWILGSGGSSLNLSGSSGFTKEVCNISETYNQLSPSTCLIKETQFRDRHRDWTCLTGSAIVVENVPVYQESSTEPMPETEVTAKSFTSPSGECWVFLIWNKETYSGSKLYYCQGVPLYAKAAVLHCLDGNTTLYRLKI